MIKKTLIATIAILLASNTVIGVKETDILASADSDDIAIIEYDDKPDYESEEPGDYKENKDTIPEWSYKVLDKDHITITHYNSHSDVVTIPKTIDGYEVLSITSFGGISSNVKEVYCSDGIDILDHAFSNCWQLEKVHLPSDMIYIPDYCFYDCKNLTVVEIPRSVAGIGDYAFAKSGVKHADLSHIKYLGDGSFSGSNISEIRLSNRITTIPSHCFENCDSLFEIDLPDSVTSIEAFAFQNCTYLREVNLNKVSKIDSFAFDNCVSLKEVEIPYLVKSLSNAFNDCKKLSKVTIYYNTDVYSEFKDCYILTINCYSNSSAYKYAKENNIDVTLINSYVNIHNHIADESDDHCVICGEPKPKEELLNIEDCYVEEISSFLYTGKPITFDLKIRDKSVLSKDHDYKLTFSNNTNAGTAKVTITGINHYTGSITKTFKIVKQSIENANITVPNDLRYARKPVPTIKIGNYTLKNNVDYKLSYTDTKTGVIVKVTGINNYSGVASHEFFNKQDISKAKIENISNKVYTGKAITQTPVVKYGSIKLDSSNYTVSYKNNKKIGTATITIKGKNDFYGSITKTFKIVPKSTTIKKIVASDNKIKVTAAKQTDVTGYQITYSKNKSFKTEASVTSKSTTMTLNKIKKGTYYIKVRTYKTVNDTKYYSKYSTVKKITIK